MSDKSLAIDQNGVPIQGGTSINVFEVSLTNAAFAAVTIPGSVTGCKKVYAKLRDNSAWVLSPVLVGTTYMTMLANTVYEFDIAANSADTLFYAKSSAGTGTLEVLVID